MEHNGGPDARSGRWYCGECWESWSRGMDIDEGSSSQAWISEPDSETLAWSPRWVALPEEDPELQLALQLSLEAAPAGFQGEGFPTRLCDQCKLQSDLACGRADERRRWYCGACWRQWEAR